MNWFLSRSEKSLTNFSLSPIINKIALVAVATTLLGACREGIDIADPGSKDTTTPPVDNVGVVNDSAGFYVKLHEPDKIKYYEHRVTGYDQPCKITSLTSAGNIDIKCVFDVPEEDLHFHGVKFQYNVPSDMCTYVQVVPYSFANYYNQAILGSDPLEEDLTVFIGSNGDVGLDDTGLDGSVDTPDFTGMGIKDILSDGTPVCRYDHSQGNSGKPNCCEGKYKLTVYKWNPDKTPTPGYDAPVASDREWGGKLSSCYAGPAFDTAPGFDKDGFPKVDIAYVEGTGINNTYAPPAPIQKGGFQTIYLANHFPNIDLMAENAAFAATDYPLAMRNKDTSPAYRNTSASYQFICFNRSREVLARIRAYVKEWNSFSEFQIKGDPYASGTGAGFGWDDIDDFEEWFSLDQETAVEDRFPEIEFD